MNVGIATLVAVGVAELVVGELGAARESLVAVKRARTVDNLRIIGRSSDEVGY